MPEKTFYTNEISFIPVIFGAKTLICKCPNSNNITTDADAAEKFFRITFEIPGEYIYQQITDGHVVAEGSFTVRQDLAHAPANYDGRSLAVRTLEALDAKLAGRVLTIQQSSITVGDRTIHYMNSIDELLKWRNFFAEKVRAEKGLSSPKSQVLILRKD